VDLLTFLIIVNTVVFKFQNNQLINTVSLVISELNC